MWDSSVTRPLDRLIADAQAIWQAGVDAVGSQRLVREQVRVEDGMLLIGDEAFDLDDIGRILVVGAGKAGAGMALGLEAALGEQLAHEKQLTGWVNVPEDCLQPTRWIHLHAARPAGINEPTAAGIAGTEAILQLLATARPNDLCICLISGGGSALLPAPAEGVTLADKQQVAQALSAAGADIREINTVRKHLSRIKGGRLAAACRVGKHVTLIVSDVLGDPLDLIASGPTVPDASTAAEALAILDKFSTREAGVSRAVFERLERAARERASFSVPAPGCKVFNVVIGNNAVAVDAAGLEAERRGYSHAMICANSPEGNVSEVAHRLAEMGLRMRTSPGPDCLISGGEPVVRLAPAAVRGRGGRNQQLVLAALAELASLSGIVLLSGGTDGEDGPTDAAGGMVHAGVLARAAALGLDVKDYLARNDAYMYLQQTGGLLLTGPTHTNVCDLRVMVVDRCEL
jgi:hydroxypyruvate reductase